MRKLVFLVLLLLVSRHLSWAAPVEVQARLSESTIYLGEQVQLEVRVVGVRDPELPDIQHPDMDVTRQAGQSFSSSSTSVINGRTTRVETVGYVARYLLRPRLDGTFRLPAVAITHEGETYQSQPLTLVVRTPADQDFLLAEMSTDKAHYTLGERITVTLDVSLRQLTIDGKELDIDPFFTESPPHLEIPWFESLGDWKTSDLHTFVKPFLNRRGAGFFINEYVDQRGLFRQDHLPFTLPRHRTLRHRSSGQAGYFTYRLQKTFRPIRTGSQTIPAVLVKATLPIEIDARRRVRRTEQIVASSQSLTVDIRPVPRAGRPATFNGAVGRFRLAATASPTALKVGDPLSLTISVQQQEDSLLETVRPLRLEGQAMLARDFKLQTDPPAVATADNAKSFTYTVRPRHRDVREIPPIEFAYYDPEAATFRVLRSRPIPLQVEGTDTLEISDVIVSSEGHPTSRLGQQLKDGLLANYTGPEVLVPQSAQLHFSPFLGGLVVVPPMLYVVLLLGRYGWQRRRQEPGRQRQRKAARVALTQLRTLSSQSDRHEASIGAGVHRALAGYIRDKLGLSGAGLTVDDMTHHLRQCGVEPVLIQQAETLLHRCDSVRYAPSPLVVTELTELIEEAETLVQRLEASSIR